MNVLNVLSKFGVEIPTPRWLISLFLHIQVGSRGVSVGTRVIILNADNAVFLVKHSYLAGWYFPGGGVERGEVPLEAAKREMREEARMIATGQPELYGLFLNRNASVPDYIACYIVRDWVWDTADGARPAAMSDDGEIIDADFFPLDALPEGISPATRARLKELAEQRVPAEDW